MLKNLTLLAQKSAVLVLFVLLVLHGGSIVCHAQTDQGSIVGTVVDSSGAAISGATVSLTNVDTNLEFSRTTDGSGIYTFSPIKIGSYKLLVDANGFEKISRPCLASPASHQL